MFAYRLLTAQSKNKRLAMIKKEIIKNIAELIRNSNFIVLGSVDFICLLKKVFDENKKPEDAFSQIYNREKINLQEQFLGIKINIEKEKRIFRELVDIIKTLLPTLENITKENLTEIYQKYAGCLEICPFNDKFLHLIIINFLFYLDDCLKFITFKESLQYKKNFPDVLLNFWDEKDELLDVTKTEVLNKGFVFFNKIVVYPCFNYKLKEVIIPLFRRLKEKIKLKIYPSYWGDLSHYSDIDLILEERIFGIPFKEENFKKVIKNRKNFGEYQYCFKKEKEELLAKCFYVPLLKMDYVLKRLEEKKFSVSLEEVIDFNKNDWVKYPSFVYHCDSEYYVMHRYIHAIFNLIEESEVEIIHLDMSLKIYDKELYNQRIKIHLNDKIVKPLVKKKIFRIDAEEERKVIGLEDFKNIIVAALDCNPEILKFLNGK
jgi:hypothetical protein